MAARGNAVHTAAIQLRRYGELEPSQLTSLHKSTWSEGDFSTALFVLNRYPNESFASITLRKIEQEENITDFPAFPQLLKFAINNHRRVSLAVVARWGSHLARTGNFSLLNNLLLRTGSSGLPSSMLQTLNDCLATSVVNITSTEIANLMSNLTKSKFKFAPESYETLLTAASKLWFPSRELGLLVYSMIRTTISPLTAVRYLGLFSGQIESKFLTMTAQDRARFLCAYTTVWSDISPKIIKAVMRDADLSLLEDSEVANILAALSRHPMRGDEAVFQAAEELIVEFHYVSSYTLSGLIHSFLRRKQGSNEFRNWLRRKALEKKTKLPSGLFLLWRNAKVGRDDREALEVELRKSLQVAEAVTSSTAQLLEAGDEEAATALQKLASDWGYKPT